MNKDLYQLELMDHYRNPRNNGVIEAADFSSGEYNPSCGDAVSLTGTITGQLLINVRFQGKGCVISQATASMLTEYVQGKQLSDIHAITNEDILTLIGMQLGPNRLKCALLPLFALRAGIELYQKKVTSQD
jgi:nitrogen fixation NifU-like protein